MKRKIYSLGIALSLMILSFVNAQSIDISLDDSEHGRIFVDGYIMGVAVHGCLGERGICGATLEISMIAA